MVCVWGGGGATMVNLSCFQVFLSEELESPSHFLEFFCSEDTMQGGSRDEDFF